jgi:ABC-type nitrate/sulfonate/bicarbonate transport system permease component
MSVNGLLVQSTPVTTVAEKAAAVPLLQQAWCQRVLTWGAIAILWQLFAMKVGPFFFPTIPEVVAGAFEAFGNGSLWTVVDSYQQMFVGFAAAVVVGVPIGLLMGQLRLVNFVIGPFINAFFVTSLAALLPFLILLFGTDFLFRAAVVFLYSVFYLIITPAAGVQAIDRGITEMGASFSVGPVRRLLSITLPGTLPYIITGVRLGLGQAVQGMIVAELWVALGTGKRLQSLGFAHELGEFFAFAAVVVAIGAALTGLVIYAQKKLTPWAGDVENAVGGAR